MKKLRNTINVKLGSNRKDYLKFTLKPSYTSHTKYLTVVQPMRKGKLAIKLNKPAYSRMCILELSSALMYKFHYDYTKNKYDNKSKLEFTDTDS